MPFVDGLPEESPQDGKAPVDQEKKEARSIEAGYSCSERRYANLGHLLPI